MNIIEAIKEAQKGKYIYRPPARDYSIYRVVDNDLCEVSWSFLEEGVPYPWTPEYTGFEAIDAEDILADDWEAVDEYPEGLRW